ncbi:MAG TPA: hypothetical protein D7I03_06880, partial [Candidatus Poseidoniales archaeon]
MDLNLINEAVDGSRRSLARTLSLIENGEISIEQIRQVLNIEGNPSDSKSWNSLAITGAPGVGKSCLIDKLLSIWA